MLECGYESNRLGGSRAGADVNSLSVLGPACDGNMPLPAPSSRRGRSGHKSTPPMYQGHRTLRQQLMSSAARAWRDGDGGWETTAHVLQRAGGGGQGAPRAMTRAGTNPTK